MGKLLGGLSYFYSPRKILPLILMQFQITNIWSVRVGVLYLICETSPWNTYNKNTLIKQSKGLNGDLKPEHMETTNRTTTISKFELNAKRMYLFDAKLDYILQHPFICDKFCHYTFYYCLIVVTLYTWATIVIHFPLHFSSTFHFLYVSI